MKNPTILYLAILLDLALITAFPESITARSQLIPSQVANETRSVKPRETRKKIKYKPPKVGAPDNRLGGASRGDNCGTEQKFLQALLPANNLGLTISEYPTLFVYIPPISTQLAELKLREADSKKVVYQKILKLRATSGIVSFSIGSKDMPPLKIGHNYRWILSIICNSQDRSEDAFVGGWIQRIEPSSTLMSQLNKTKPRDAIALYAESGIWHETLTTLAQMRYSYPQDSTASADWVELLESVGLGKIAQEPLIN